VGFFFCGWDHNNQGAAPAIHIGENCSLLPHFASDRPVAPLARALGGPALLLRFQSPMIGYSDFSGIKCAVQTWRAHPWPGVFIWAKLLLCVLEAQILLVASWKVWLKKWLAALNRSP